MPEEKKQEQEEEEDKEEEKTADEKSADIIDKTNLAAERLEKANMNMSDNLTRQENLQQEQKLSGKAKAGKPSKKELTDKEYAAKVMGNEIETTK